MKKLFLFTMVMFVASLSYADSVRGYTRSDGTYVQPHQRSNSNDTYTDNWSYKSNTNPYTGEKGSNSYGESSTRSSKGVSDRLGTWED